MFMKKLDVSFENLLAGLILRFGKANEIDIKVVQKDLFNKYGVLMSPFAIDYHCISNYIMKVRDNYYPLSDEAKIVLREKQGKFMESYLEALNVEDFVLLKLAEYGNIPEYMFGTILGDEQEKAVSKLVEDFKGVYVWNDDVAHEDYQEIQLTSLGRARVFELQYGEQVQEFKELLVSSGYDVSLMVDFLRVQDFSRDVYDILNLDNFLLYCNTYDRAPMAPKDGSADKKFGI